LKKKKIEEKVEAIKESPKHDKHYEQLKKYYLE
jgi:hypothetical protein